MAEPFLSEIRMMSFGFAPQGWALCNGQFMPINQNQALFSLLGTMYGGNGQTTFALPDLRGRAPMHVGQGHTEGERGGEVNHTLNVNETPTHTHLITASTDAALLDTPAGQVLAVASLSSYGTAKNLQAMATGVVAPTGGSQPHLNLQPYLVINFCIALQGIFPSPT